MKLREALIFCNEAEKVTTRKNTLTLLDALAICERFNERVDEKSKKKKSPKTSNTDTFKEPLITTDEKGRKILSDYRLPTRERKKARSPRKIYLRGDVYLLGTYDFFKGYDKEGRIYIDTNGLMKLIERGRAYKHNALTVARNVLNGVFDKPFIGKNHESGVPALYAYSVDDKGVFWRIVIDLEGEHAGMITTLIDDDNHAKRRYQSIQNGTESK